MFFPSHFADVSINYWKLRRHGLRVPFANGKQQLGIKCFASCAGRWQQFKKACSIFLPTRISTFGEDVSRVSTINMEEASRSSHLAAGGRYAKRNWLGVILSIRVMAGSLLPTSGGPAVTLRKVRDRKFRSLSPQLALIKGGEGRGQGEGMPEGESTLDMTRHKFSWDEIMRRETAGKKRAENIRAVGSWLEDSEPNKIDVAVFYSWT